MKNVYGTRIETDLIIQPSADGTMGPTLLIQILDDIFFGTSSLVVHGCLVILGEEFDSRETRNVVFLGNTLVLLVVGIDVGDDTLCGCKWRTIDVD